MAGKEYYEILGVARTANAEEIKRAYRKLARLNHPDVNKAPDAQKKFTEIQHAYDILSDDAKRKMYDQFGESYVSGARSSDASGGGGSGGGGGGPHVRWSNVAGSGGRAGGSGFEDLDVEDLSSMFDAMFGGRGGGGGGGGGFGSDAAGASAKSGRSARGKRSSSARAQPPEPEAPVHHDLHISFMVAVKGGTETLQLQSGGVKRTVEVNIPAGIQDGATLRVRNAFAASGGPELLLNVRIGGHPVFQRGEGLSLGKGNDLFVDLPLTIAEATLGASVPVPTIEGKVEVTVPPGTASGKRLRLKGKGIRSAGGDAGDLYAVIKIVPPRADDLTEDERAILRLLSSKGPDPRASQGAA